MSRIVEPYSARHPDRRPARPRRGRIVGLVALAVALLLLPGLARATVEPAFDQRIDPFSLANVDRRAVPAFGDLDGDGDLDLLAGTSAGEVVYFENVGDAASPAFGAPVTLPFGIPAVGSDATPTLGDLDGDGDLDLLLGSLVGDLRYLRNDGTTSAPSFAAAGTNPFGLSRVGQYTVPGLADLDGDGDLDAVVGELGGRFFVFRNDGDAQHPSFSRVSDVNGLGPLADEFSSPALADIDGDGRIDVLAGARDGRVRVFANAASSGELAFSFVGASPFGLSDSGYFAAPAAVDLDGDGDLDVVVGTDEGSFYFYENTGTATAPLFAGTFARPFGLGPLASFARPAFGDLDGDGDQDALVWEQGDPEGRFWLLENVGDEHSPAFATAVPDPFGIVHGAFATPELGDLDGDGDLDLLVGGDDGNTLLYENVGTATAAAFGAPVTNPFGLSDVGSWSAPALGDLDGDGDLDLVLGLSTGSIRYFENDGAASAPSFADRGIARIALGQNPAFDLTDIDLDGDLDVVAGNADGVLLVALNEGTRTVPVLTSGLRLPFGLSDVGGFALPVMVDIDADGDADALVGARTGAILLFEAQPLFACPATPDPDCASFAQGSLLVKETVAGREQIAVQIKGGPALTQSDLGDPTPTRGTRYALCLYDDAQQLATELIVDRPGRRCGGRPCWKGIGGDAPGGKGWAYKDADASASGVKQLSLKAGAAGKPTIALKAQNDAAHGRTSLPTGVADALYSSGSVTVQLRSSNAVGCHATTLFTSTRSPGFLKAR